MRVDLSIRLGSLELRNSEIAHLEVHQELGRHSYCYIDFTRDRATDVEIQNLLGATAVVTLEDENGQSVVFTGELATGSQSHLVNFGSRFSIEAASLSLRLQAHRNTAYFPNSTLSDVARKLGASVAGSVSGGEKLNYVQSCESDFDFLLRIADDHGCFVRPTEKTVEIRREFARGSAELVWAQNLLAVTARCRPTNPGFKGASYEVADKHDHRFHGVRKAPAWLGGASQIVNQIQARALQEAGGGDPNFPESVARAPRLADYRSLLERESERALGTAILVEGTSTHIGMAIGDRVMIRDGENFKLPTAGNFGLVRVVHRFDGQTYSNDFVATPWAGYSNPASPVRRGAAGCVTAEVVENVDPQKTGRLRVRYRWQGVEERTGWIRSVAPYAGAGRGFVFLPEIGDEVVIAFEEGDPERPYVLGALWNGKDVSPQVDEVKKIVSRSGNTIQLVDTGGQELVEIYSASGHCLLQLANAVGGQPRITIHSEGDISIEAKGEIRMTCESLVQEVRANATRTVKGNDHADVKGGIVLKSGMDVSVAAGMNASVQAGMNVDSVAGAMNNVVGSLVHIQPPGHVAKKAKTKRPPSHESIWEKKEVPKPAKGKSTADRPTPRSGG